MQPPTYSVGKYKATRAHICKESYPEHPECYIIWDSEYYGDRCRVVNDKLNKEFNLLKPDSLKQIIEENGLVPVQPEFIIGRQVGVILSEQAEFTIEEIDGKYITHTTLPNLFCCAGHPLRRSGKLTRCCESMNIYNSKEEFIKYIEENIICYGNSNYYTKPLKKLTDDLSWI